MGYTCFP